MKQVEIFKTNVNETAGANEVLTMLGRKHPAYLANFDIEDEDHILRIESTTTQINSVEIETLLKSIGIYCKVLLD